VDIGAPGAPPVGRQYRNIYDEWIYMKRKKEVIWVGIIIVVFAILIVIFKMTYKDIHQPTLAKDNITYEQIGFNGNTSSYQEFECKEPKFKMAIPVKFEMNTLMENQGGKIYDLIYKADKIQIRVIDLYGLTNSIATPRKAYSYNAYSDYSMKQSYREYIKAFSENVNGRNIIESGIKKLKGNLLIYLRDEQIDKNGKTLTTIRYNFLKDGYSIEIIGYVLGSSIGDTVINSMNSFTYSE
jgi:hypothetical protein